jgi:hypothetical protein
VRPVREADIEAYFCAMVARAGGEQRKVRWIGRRGCPDRFVWWPGTSRPPAFVEFKAPGGTARAEQAREHDLLRAGGVVVLVLDTRAGVDDYIGA